MIFCDFINRTIIYLFTLVLSSFLFCTVLKATDEIIIQDQRYDFQSRPQFEKLKIINPENYAIIIDHISDKVSGLKNRKNKAKFCEIISKIPFRSLFTLSFNEAQDLFSLIGDTAKIIQLFEEKNLIPTKYFFETFLREISSGENYRNWKKAQRHKKQRPLNDLYKTLRLAFNLGVKIDPCKLTNSLKLLYQYPFYQYPFFENLCEERKNVLLEVFEWATLKNLNVADIKVAHELIPDSAKDKDYTDWFGFIIQLNLPSSFIAQLFRSAIRRRIH